MRLAPLALLLAAPAAAPAAAQEFVTVGERLSDRDFHRLVACAAPPGGACAKPMMRWPAGKRRGLSVGLLPPPPGLPDWKAALVEEGVARAVAEVNGAGAGIRLRAVDGPGDVTVRVVGTPPGGIIGGTGEEALDGRPLPLALVAVRRDRGTGAIAEAQIALSAGIRRREVAPVLLEEVVQALGLVTDVGGAAYHRSIFSETGNSAAFLRGQDAAALRLHYPPPGG